jgi:hypothetical protein
MAAGLPGLKQGTVRFAVVKFSLRSVRAPLVGFVKELDIG